MENHERKKTTTWEDPAVSARSANDISGLDYLNSIKNGKVAPPPIARLLGYYPIEVDQGHVVFGLNPEECHYNPFSTVHGGILATLLDTAMGAAVLSTLGAGVSCSTVEIKVNFIRPVFSQTGLLRCEAIPIHIGKKLATVQGRIEDQKGKLIAHGVGTCSIFEMVNDTYK